MRKEIDLKKLRGAIEKSETVLTDFRQKRMTALKEYLGAHYSSMGTSHYNPVNLLELTVNIYMQSLAARAPKVLASTPHRNLKPSAANLELALNALLKKINLSETLQNVVMEAFFGIGVIYTGLNASGKVEIGGVTHDVGQPFSDAIYMDEFFMDMSARTPEQCQFMGHSYLMPRDQYTDSGIFKKVELSKAEKRPFGPMGTERSETLSTGGISFDDDYKDFVRLRNIWLPLDGPTGKLIVVEDLEDGTEDTGILMEIEWDGPEQGPYKVLKFSNVPGNLMPLPPVANLMDLHRLGNNVFRKIEDDARNQKTVLGYMAGADKDAERIISSNNREAIRMDNPDKVREFSFNGVDPKSLAFMIEIKNMYSWFAGNLDSLGGLGPQSGTVGQDKMLAENASRRIAHMQNKVIDFTKSVVEDLGYYLWNDPLIHMPLTKRVPGVNLDIPTEFSAMTKSGDFTDYDISIEPYSMQHTSPGIKLQALRSFINEVVLPLQPLLEQQGKTIDIDVIARKFGKYADFDDIYEIITSMGIPLAPDTASVSDGPRKAPVSTRNYVREDRGVQTGPGRDHEMMQSLLNMNEPQRSVAHA
jgi:hypothetical protein